jgi:serpin B
MTALTMAANGTGAGETRAQMVEVLCGASLDSLTKYLSEYLGSLHSSEHAKLHTANSVWFRDDPLLQVKDSFLSSMAGNFDADVYKAPFDQTTVDAINAWCSENTDGMIPEVINQIDPATMLYLINALLFDAQWDNTYRDVNVSDAIFTTADGVQQDVKLMYSVEDRYLRDDYAVGTVKNYAKGGYKFVAMLPNEGITLEQYVASLTGEGINTMLREGEYAIVKTKLPKFKTECSYTLQDILKAMGMPLAFDRENADFSEMGSYDAANNGNLYIGEVIHKTAIEVNEIGTRAAAVTVVDLPGESAPPDQTYYLTFDRPFVYMIIDRNNVPLFIGVVNEIE